MKTIKELRGYSGCKIILIQNNCGCFVRKISKNINYNKRLKNQITKQILFNHPNIKTPNVFNSGYLNDLFYVDMEYISGVSLSEYIQNNHPNNVIQAVRQVIDFKARRIANADYSKLHLKINTLINNFCDSLQHKAYLLKIKQLKINSWGYCHGDLSLENIIIKNNEIYLIDFLDSFLDSQIVDISKIFMDLIYGWSWRRNLNIPFVKNKIILDGLKKLCQKQDLDLIQYFIGLHLFRIKPYLENQKDKILIDQSIDHCINCLKL